MLYKCVGHYPMRADRDDLRLTLILNDQRCGKRLLVWTALRINRWSRRFPGLAARGLVQRRDVLQVTAVANQEQPVAAAFRFGGLTELLRILEKLRPTSPLGSCLAIRATTHLTAIGSQMRRGCNGLIIRGTCIFQSSRNQL